MKFFIVLTLCVAVASARFIIPDVAAAKVDKIKDTLASIHHPSTDPTTAAALQQLLNDILGIHVGPAIVGPTIVESLIEPSPVIVQENEETSIHVGPAMIDEQTPSDSLLVQYIIDVNSGASVAGSPVVVEGPEPTSVIIDEIPEVIVEQPIINAPIFPSPVVAPDDLN